MAEVYIQYASDLIILLLLLPNTDHLQQVEDYVRAAFTTQ